MEAAPESQEPAPSAEGPKDEEATPAAEATSPGTYEEAPSATASEIRASAGLPFSAAAAGAAFSAAAAWKKGKVRLGTASGFRHLYYCGRVVGKRALPGSDGLCGPADGPQCTSCCRFQRREQPEEAAADAGAGGYGTSAVEESVPQHGVRGHGFRVPRAAAAESVHAGSCGRARPKAQQQAAEAEAARRAEEGRISGEAKKDAEEAFAAIRAVETVRGGSNEIELRKEAFEQKMVMQLRNIKDPQARRAKLEQLREILVSRKDQLSQAYGLGFADLLRVMENLNRESG